MALSTTKFASREALNESFATEILALLQSAIDKKGKASIAVSGGSTPKALFETLSNCDFPWDKVSITLADERWVSASHNDSNEKLVNENLLVNKAAAATFVSLTTSDTDAVNAEEVISQRVDDLGEHIDVVILGMGEDGHTASLFPCSAQISEGLNLQRKLSAIATQPTTAPHQRMSLSLAKIIQSPNVFLHLTSDKKLAVLEDALANYTAIEKPIKAVCEHTNVKLMWAS